MGGMTSHIFWQNVDDSQKILNEALQLHDSCYEDIPSQEWDAKTGTIGDIRDSKLSFLYPSGTNWTGLLIHLNSLFGDSLASAISKMTNGISILFYEYDQAAWGYHLFNNGEILDQFWNLPEVVELNAADFAGNASLMASTFNAKKELIEPYLKHITEKSEGKILPDDEFEITDHWVRVDFMKRLNLLYSDLKNGKYIFITENKINEK
jgi:hypothetical protein